MTRETPTRMDDQRHANTRDLRGHVILGGRTHALIGIEVVLTTVRRPDRRTAYGRLLAAVFSSGRR